MGCGRKAHTELLDGIRMVSRRRFLSTAGVALTATTVGCSTRQGSDDSTVEPTVTDAPTGTPTSEPQQTTTSETESDSDSNGLADWAPAWTFRAEADAVQSLRMVGNHVVALAGDETGPSTVFMTDTQTGSQVWRTRLDGAPASGTHLAHSNARDDWALTLTDDALYVLTGNAAEYEWTALTALDPSMGSVKWALRQERNLAVAGIQGETIVVGSREFFEPQTSHDTSDSPLETVMYGVGTTTGDIRWSQGFRAVSVATTAVSTTVVAADNRIIGLGRGGTEQWTVETAGRIRALHPFGDRIIAAVEAGDGSNLRAIAPDGTQQWQLRRPVDSFFSTTDRLYALGDETLSIDPTGSVRWQVDGYGTWPLLSPDGRTLYARAGRLAAAVDAFDLREGGRRFRYDTPSDNGWPTAAANTFVAAEAITPDAAESTSLFAIDATSGEATAVYRPSAPVYAAAGAHQRVYVGIGSALVALDEP